MEFQTARQIAEVRGGVGAGLLQSCLADPGCTKLQQARRCEPCAVASDSDTIPLWSSEVYSIQVLDVC